MEISTPTAMTPCDPLETQTLCSGNVRGQPPPPSRGGMRESRPCLPLPWEWNAHRGSSSSGRGSAGPAQRMGEGRRLQALRLECLFTPLSRNNSNSKKPLEQFWLPSYKSGQLTSSQGGIMWTSARASHTALPPRLPCGPVVYPLLLQLVSRLPDRQDADCNFITFPSTPHAHFYLRLCTYRFCLFFMMTSPLFNRSSEIGLKIEHKRVLTRKGNRSARTTTSPTIVSLQFRVTTC